MNVLRNTRPVPRRRWRRAGPVLAVLALVTAVLGYAAPPAQATAKWHSGGIKYTTITNCPSIILGYPYQEQGIGAFASYWGDQDSNPIKPVVGESTYLDIYVQLLGSHCGTPIIYPKFVLPAGVVFDKTEPIKCFYTPPGPGTQRQITHAAECPQWSRVSADGWYSSTQTGWGSGWPLPQGDDFVNGSAWEFQVPIKATTQQFGSQLRTELGIADGYAGPTLDLTVPFWTGPAPVTAPGTPTNVSAHATSSSSAQVSFSPPASNGGAAITGYSARCQSSTGGVAQTATGNSSPISVTGLTPGQSYRCDVRASNNAGPGGWSTQSSSFTTPPVTTRPGKPTSVTTTVLSAKSARVAFSPPADDGGSPITSYRAQCVSPDGGTKRTADGASSPITFTNLTPGKDYRCRVKASNAVGTSGYSSYSPLVAMPPTTPDRPTGVTATAKTRSSAQVAFTPPAYDGGGAVTGYRVQCASPNGGTTRTSDSAGSPSTVTRLSPGKAYKCRVRAVNEAGAGAYSAYSARFTLPS